MLWHRTLKKGEAGEDVKFLQAILVMCGAPGFDHKGIDGDFGPKTETAVKWFQTNHPPLVVDGIVGPKTQAKLPIPGTKLLEEGDQGPVVKALQTGLKASGYLNTDPGALDGNFGPKTKKAVLAYQKATVVPQDGVVGYHTWWVKGPTPKFLAEWAGLTKPC